MAKSQALATRDPRDEPFEKFQAQDEPPYSSHRHSSRSENGETFDQITRKEKKKKQCWLEHEWAQNNFGFIPGTNINAPNIASTACKDLSHITCFNYDKKGQYAIKFPKPKKDKDALED